MLKEICDRLKESILLRMKQDVPLIDWFIAILISFVTMNIYGLVIIFKRCVQADNYVARKILYFQNVGEFITELSQEKGRVDTNHERLNSLIMQYKTKCKPIKPFFLYIMLPYIILISIISISLIVYIISNIVDMELNVVESFTFFINMITVIHIIIVSIFIYIYMSKLTKIWINIQDIEKEIYEVISQSLMSLELLEKPVELEVMKKKIFQNLPLTMVIGILTLGIFVVLWDYFIHNLPPKVFQNLHAAEDKVYSVLRIYCNEH